MRSIERRFKLIQKNNPNWSSYLCFSATVRGMNFSQDVIEKWFGILVKKDDYMRKDKKTLLSYLGNL